VCDVNYTSALTDSKSLSSFTKPVILFRINSQSPVHHLYIFCFISAVYIFVLNSKSTANNVMLNLADEKSSVSSRLVLQTQHCLKQIQQPQLILHFRLMMSVQIER